MSSYRNERRKYVPVIGDEVVLTGRYGGTYLVDEVDAVEKTAVVRHKGTNALLNGVEWTTMLPLKHLEGLAAIVKAIDDGEPPF
ncbi:MAG: hypothetical protein ABSE36_19780 [Terracidiphilus sp.]|jgi:hypothetical protein